MMKYFYLTADGTTAGPETLETLAGMLGSGAVTLGTLVVPAGGEDWTPLARVLRFFYADEAGATAGPVAFSEINRLHQIAALPAEAWIMEEGGTEWKSVAAVLTDAGVPVIIPPAPAITRTATGAYRPPPMVRAGHGHHGRTTAIRYRATGGIGRLQYFLFFVLLGVLFFGGMIAVGANIWSGEAYTMDQLKLLFERSTVAVVILLSVLSIGGIVLAALRVQNIGWPWYFLAWNLVLPIALFAYPPGYARHKHFDTASKVVAGIVVGLIIAVVVLVMLFGKRESTAPGKSDKPTPAGQT